jgi:hypothetical protein
MWFAHVSRQELVPDLARAIPPSPKALGRGELSPHDRAPKSVPRPLALAPRADPVIAVQGDSGPSPVPSPSRPTIPKSASKETVDKVRRWSALVTPDPALGTVALPAVPVPAEEVSAPISTVDTPAPLSTEETPDDEPLNLEDFQWSITSAGPPSPTSSCATSASSRVVSIHLLERNEGSVLLTPTTATSWGPPSVSDVESDLNLNLGWRVRSPDLGERAEGSVLLTPSTATTWGAPLSYPPTPAQWHAMQQYVRSPDVGERAEGSVLLTPSTATTWGAPETYPQTPEMWAEAQRRWVPSPDMGARAEVEGEFGRDRMSTMTWGEEVETEEEAYARMGITWRSEHGWSEGDREGSEVIGAGSRSVSSDRGEDEAYEEGALAVFVTEQGAEADRRSPFDFGWPRFEPNSGDVPQEAEQSMALSEGRSAEFGVLGFERGLDGVADAFEYELPDFEPVPTDEETDEDVATSDAFEFELPAAEPATHEDEDEDASVDAGSSQADEYDLPHFEIATGEDGDAFDDEPSYFEPPVSTHSGTFEFTAPTMALSTKTMTAGKTVSIIAATTTARTRSYGAYPYLVLYPAAYPHLDIYPAAPAAVLTARPTLSFFTEMHAVEVVDPTTGMHSRAASLSGSTSAFSPIESTPVSVESFPSPAELTPSLVESAMSQTSLSPVESMSSQTDSRILNPPSRKPSLSVRVPRSRSSTIVAVNPGDKRSRAWSRALPPVPPVPREILARKESTESMRSVIAPAVPRRLHHLGRKPSVVFDDTQFELC